MAVDLSPNAFITVAELKAHLGRTTGAEETDVADRAANAINAATAWLEEWTRRALKARNHKQIVTTTITGALATTSVTAASASGLNVGDDVFGPAGIAYGTRVTSISGNTVGLSLALTSDLSGGGSASFGSRPLVISGDGTSSALVPEYPVIELFGAYSLDDNGTRTAINITGHRVSRAGVLHLPNDFFPEGDLNIHLECRAGYEPPTGTTLADLASLDLKRIAYRASEVFFLQAKTPTGRAEDFSVGPFSARKAVDWMPADLIADVRRFQRVA